MLIAQFAANQVCNGTLYMLCFSLARRPHRTKCDLFCSQRYNFSPTNIIYVVSNNTVKQSFWRSVDSSDFRFADFVRELILARGGALDTNCVSVRDEMQETIDYICSL
jgi:hypothetical protein